MIKSYIKYRHRRKGPFRIHSPFVFEFVTKALRRTHNDDYEKLYSIYRTIDKHRFCPRSKRRKARLIYKTTAFFDLEDIVVAGKMNAMNIAALALGCQQAQLHTTSWDETYDELESLGINNIKPIETDDIDSLLADNEREQAMIFLATPICETAFISNMLPDDIIMIDDIHADHDTEEAWEELKANPKVAFSMDFYHIGLLFFKEGFEKQDFIIKY